MKKSTLQYTILGVLLAWALTAQITFSWLLVRAEASSKNLTHLPFSLLEYSTRIRDVLPLYAAGGLKPGDEVITLNGHRVEGEIQIDEERFRMRPGETLTLTVNRSENGKSKTVTVEIVLKERISAALGWTLVIGVSVMLPLLCLLVGFYIAFARPSDPLAWITLAMLASFGQVVGTGTSWAIASPWRELLLIYHPILSNTWALWMVLFSFHFPVPFPFVRRRPWIIALLAMVPAGLAVLELYGNFEEGYHLDRLHWLATFEQQSNSAVTILFISYVFAFFFFLILKKSLLTAHDSRRRLNIMLAGCGLSLTPLLALACGQMGVIPRFPPWLVTISLLMLAFFPITMAYVIVVQRAMDVRMVVRSGVQYAFASTGARAVQILLTVSVVWLTVHFEQETNHKVVGFAILGGGIALIALVGRIARGVSMWMDRRFFREAYNADLILTELSSSVAGIRDTKRLLETVVHRIADSLHVSRIAVLLEASDCYKPAYAFGFQGGPPEVQFTKETSTIRTLKRLQSASRIYFDDPQSWVHGTPQPEQTALQTLETQVLLPLNLESKMLGVISLGSKRSEAPYTKGDLQLLSAVAAQTGLALENAQLTESIRREVAQRERLDRELEIAREVQQRLFPQKLPEVQGLDFGGYCRPAQGVGGDYYDFIRLPDGCLGIAVGDVSGKGIAAALMMASLQASLRGQTIKPCATLSEMIQLINQLVYEASAENRYATFFYAQYDPRQRKLRYVNAGHNPPIVCRKRGSEQEFLRLEEGGTVIGLFPDFPYREGSIDLEQGDILVAFTDGISEAMNRRDEEFDEERLIEALRNCTSRSAADMITYLLEEVDSFTAGAKQHDDMTLVVARLR